MSNRRISPTIYMYICVSSPSHSLSVFLAISLSSLSFLLSHSRLTLSPSISLYLLPLSILSHTLSLLFHVPSPPPPFRLLRLDCFAVRCIRKGTCRLRHQETQLRQIVRQKLSMFASGSVSLPL